MPKYKSVMVVCVDRDDDLGRKASVQGPVVGRKACLNAAAKLALADPGDTDSNAIFATVKKFDEVKKEFENLEVVTLTGHSKASFESDKKVNEQLDAVLETFPADAFILVTDGAEDDQVIPILQSRAPIYSKEVVIVKQAQAVESTYYTIKEALKDPVLGSIVFGIPGIILVLYAVLFFLGQEKLFFQTISFILGVYLILKGTGLEEKLAGMASNIMKGMSLQRTSFPFYLAMLFVFGFGLIQAYSAYYSPEGLNLDLTLRLIEPVSSIVLFTAVSALCYVVGRAIDSVHLKKAYRLKNYFLSGVFIFIIWFIIESGKSVVIGEADLNLFLGSIVFSFVIALASFRVASVLDVRKKITKLLIGLPVYAPDGRWVGKVEKVEGPEKTIEYKDIKSKKLVQLRKEQFVLRGDRVLLTA